MAKVAVESTTIRDRSVQRLTSWLPECGNSEMAIELAGKALPTQVGTILPGPIRVLCIGPVEWLIVSEDKASKSLRTRFGSDLEKRGLVLVDLSDGVVTLELSGPAVRDLLSKGCGLDFHPSFFRAESCARTRFAQVPVVIDCVDGSPRFELIVARSYLHYLKNWIADASVEFRVCPHRSPKS